MPKIVNATKIDEKELIMQTLMSVPTNNYNCIVHLIFFVSKSRFRIL